MPVKKTKKLPDGNTETKIKAAARIVFYKKGFAGTRTRDVAREAGINLALLNYYFDSKEKLFQMIMTETLVNFYQGMGVVFHDKTTTLEIKIQLVAEKYIDLLIAEPELPIFIMSEIRSHGAEMLNKLPITNAILQSDFIRQYKEGVREGKLDDLNPLHFLMNLTGLIIFPFVNSPVLKKIGKINNRQFDKLMQERKKLIPVWMKAMISFT